MKWEERLCDYLGAENKQDFEFEATHSFLYISGVRKLDGVFSIKAKYLD